MIRHGRTDPNSLPHSDYVYLKVSKKSYVGNIISQPFVLKLYEHQQEYEPISLVFRLLSRCSCDIVARW